MKAILTLFLVLSSTTGIFATDHAKIENHQMDSLLVNRPDYSLFNKKIKKAETEEIVRLYRFKNARIKSELAFKTKKQRFIV
ncbi:MAG: hypothetical protein HKP07_07940 [Flavobacteriaceae bacterium]|nr:hypothetical protein [Flavobacteriaceae bacterium]